MSTQIVRITNEVEIPYLTYNGQPVLTFALIDKVHNRAEGTARKRFSDNRKRFIEREDFYSLDSESLSVFRTEFPDAIGENAPSLTLVTESGYLMLVKSFTDDLSWQIQRQLVKLYFRVKEEIVQLPVLSNSEYQELRRLVWIIESCFHMKGGAGWAVNATLRERLGVSSVLKIPVERRAAAVALIADLEKAACAFKHGVIELERRFFRSRFKEIPAELLAEPSEDQPAQSLMTF